MMPPAPVLELPELKIKEEPKENTPIQTIPVSHYVSKEQSSENKQMLPNTGESLSTLLLTTGFLFLITGLTILSVLLVRLFRKN